MPSVQPYVKKAQDIISNIEGAFNTSNLNSTSVCEKFEIAAIVYHFSNFLLNYDNFVDVGYDLGAISYDLVNMITGDCFDRVIDDVEDAVGDVIGWFEGFLRRRRLGDGVVDFTQEMPYEENDEDLVFYLVQLKASDPTITKGKQAFEVFLEQFMYMLTGDLKDTTECVEYIEQDSELELHLL